MHVSFTLTSRHWMARNKINVVSLKGAEIFKYERLHSAYVRNNRAAFKCILVLLQELYGCMRIKADVHEVALSEHLVGLFRGKSLVNDMLLDRHRHGNRIDVAADYLSLGVVYVKHVSTNRLCKRSAHESESHNSKCKISKPFHITFFYFRQRRIW